MSVKIILSRTSEPAERRELVFDEETISLGREPSSVLPLPGSQVSKLHAQIEREGPQYYITDLNSTNSTYLNGERLVAGRKHALSEGDKIAISDYELEVFPISTLPSLPEGSEQRPTIETRSVSAATPVREPEQSFPDTKSSDVAERWSRLTSEIQNTLERFDIGHIARSYEELQMRFNALAQENRRLREELSEIRERGKDRSTTLPDAPPPEFHPADEARLEQLSRILLQFFFKASSGRASFLSEFIVRTTFRTSSDLPVQPRTDEERLRYFVDPSLSEKEFSERLTLLKKEADQIVLHMIGLLEGYRRSVEEGTRRILQRVDPDRLGEELPDTFLLRTIPPLADLKLYHLVRNRLRDLLEEDRGVLEKQVFRPGFARAYEDCVEPTSTKA